MELGAAKSPHLKAKKFPALNLILVIGTDSGRWITAAIGGFTKKDPSKDIPLAQKRYCATANDGLPF